MSNDLTIICVVEGKDFIIVCGSTSASLAIIVALIVTSKCRY